MNWQLVIDRNRTALLTLITALMASLGLVPNGAASSLHLKGEAKYARLTTLPKFLYARALAIIRPAESALRRIIMIAALQLTPRRATCATTRTAPVMFVRRNPRVEPGLPTFNLIEPLKTFGDEAPDYSDFGPVQDEEHKDRTPIPAEALGRRLLALKLALESIPAQAKRLARWYAAQDAARAQNQPRRLNPIRPGPPPWSHRRKRSEMDKLLTECHLLAIYARDGYDSS